MVAVDELAVGPDQIASVEEVLARRDERIVRSARGWEVIGYEDSLYALGAPDILRAKLFLWRSDQIDLPAGFTRDYFARMLNTQEGEQRKHLRNPMARILSPRSTRTLAQAVQDIVDQVLDEIPDPDDVDFYHDVAWRIPPLVYCEMVSAPPEIEKAVARLSDSMLSPILTVDKSRREELEAAYREAFDIVEDHVETRRQNMSDDFTSALIQEEIDGNLTRQELYDHAVSMLVASVDNTVHTMAITVGKLLEDPSRWDAVRRDSSLVPTASEETIRMWPRFRTHLRYAPKDIELFGAQVAEDDILFIAAEGAQYDDRVFDAPFEFRVDRPVRPGPLVFGMGQYSCLGQHLARLEQHTMLETVVRRFPNARLLEYRDEPGPFIRSIERVRVSLSGK